MILLGRTGTCFLPRRASSSCTRPRAKPHTAHIELKVVTWAHVEHRFCRTPTVHTHLARIAYRLSIPTKPHREGQPAGRLSTAPCKIEPDKTRAARGPYCHDHLSPPASRESKRARSHMKRSWHWQRRAPNAGRTALSPRKYAAYTAYKATGPPHGLNAPRERREGRRA